MLGSELRHWREEEERVGFFGLSQCERKTTETAWPKWTSFTTLKVDLSLVGEFESFFFF